MALILVVFEDGDWHDRSTKIDAGAHEQSGRAERWAKEAGEIHVYQKTERTREVEVEHDTRQGKRYTTETAVVYELVERKPDLASWQAKKPKRAKPVKAAKTGGKPKKAAAQASLF